MPSPASLSDTLTRHLDRVSRQRGALGAPQVLVRTPDLEWAYGDRQRPFHIASVGKVATTVLAIQLIDDLDARLSELVPAATLEGLFVVDGVDHSTAVTVRQLLDHTSGIADYFDGRSSGPTIRQLMLSQPDRFWHPAELLEFSRSNQKAVAAPGARFAYSDTGFVLLGLVLEHVSGRELHDLLHDRIFTPLGMDDSYLMLRSEPRAPTRAIAPALIDGVDVSPFPSISADWAGGGIISTLDDLARFSVALQGGELVSAEQLADMKRVRHRFRPGIHYGTGFMTLRFAEFFFTLRGLPEPTGHIGVLGTHVFYDATHDATIVMNFGSTREMVRSFRTLIQIEALLAAQARRRRRSR